MVRIGVTGHIHLTAASRKPIYRALREVLARYDRVHGVTCLAAGADRLFAQAVHECAGTFEVVLTGGLRAGGDRLLRRASAVWRVPADVAPGDRYAAASERVLDRSDVLVAVWDGDPGGVHGGTAQTVARARERGLPVEVVWPDGAERAYVGGGSMSHSSRAPFAAARTSG